MKDMSAIIDRNLMTRAQRRVALRRLRVKKPSICKEHTRAVDTIAQFAKAIGYIGVADLCEACNEPATVMHHTNYTKPLMIVSLCSTCHGVVHEGRTPGYTTDAEENVSPEIIHEILQAEADTIRSLIARHKRKQARALQVGLVGVRLEALSK